MPNIVFSVESGITREHAVEEFKKSNIDARVFFWPLNQMFPHLSKKETPVAESLASRSINLPSFHDITKEETDRVINVVQVITKSRP
jgi:perosamine synthetase